MPPDCSELNCRNMLQPQLPVPTFQTRLRLNNTDILAQPKSSPDIKKASKAVSFHHFRSHTPKYRISIIKFLLWQSKKLRDKYFISEPVSTFKPAIHSTMITLWITNFNITSSIQTLLSASELHRIMLWLTPRLVGFTTGRELHPALKFHMY